MISHLILSDWKLLISVLQLSDPYKIEFSVFLQVIFTEENRSLLHYLTNLCAIVGGMSIMFSLGVVIICQKIATSTIFTLL